MPHPKEDLRLADVATFLAVRRRGSINQTARELEVGSSQVSKAIGRLERQLGLRLLIRTPRGVSVDPAAERMVPHLEEMLTRLHLIQERKAGPRQTVTLAAPSYLLSFALRIVTAADPGLKIRGVQLAPGLVRAHATENSFDIALSGGLKRMPSSWSRRPVGQIRHGLFAGRELARRLGQLPVATGQLQEIPFITPTYQVEGQFIPMDDGCPLSAGERQLGHEVACWPARSERSSRGCTKRWLRSASPDRHAER